MKGLSYASRYIGRTIGADAKELFDACIDDALYYAKSVSIKGIDAEIEDANEFFRELVERALMEAANVYLKEYYASDSGILEVNVTYDCVYDKDMNTIRPLKKILDRRDEIIDVSLNHIMSSYMKGRKIAKRLEARKGEYERQKALKNGVIQPSPKDANWEPALPAVQKRDYRKKPPQELLDVEIMRLERKLPNLSSQEGLRLSELYAKTMP